MFSLPIKNSYGYGETWSDLSHGLKAVSRSSFLKLSSGIEPVHVVDSVKIFAAVFKNDDPIKIVCWHISHAFNNEVICITNLCILRIHICHEIFCLEIFCKKKSFLWLPTESSIRIGSLWNFWSSFRLIFTFIMRNKNVVICIAQEIIRFVRVQLFLDHPVLGRFFFVFQNLLVYNF